MGRVIPFLFGAGTSLVGYMILSENVVAGRASLQKVVYERHKDIPGATRLPAEAPAPPAEAVEKARESALVTDMAAGFRRKWNEGVHAVHTTLADLFFRRKPQS